MIGKWKYLLQFYKTKKFNPIFTFEKGIKLIEECELNDVKDYNNQNETDLIVKLKFCGTFIDVK